MLDRLPVEIVERIVAKIPDTDLIAASKVDSVWWQEVHQEAYKRWKNYATAIGIYTGKSGLSESDRLTEDQLYIMEKMLRNRMVVDPQERETIEYALSESRWGGDPWGLDWEWNEWTQQE
ncbi:unnamed protein product [Rhizophagus irregularis]|nr:unnamed protein product [Rhizophagus irregularis]